MLTTRLSISGKAVILSSAPIEAEIRSVIKSGAIDVITARRIGTHINADFVLFGSLTIFGNSVSFDAKMVDISGRKPTMSFFDQGQELEAVFTIINRLSANINDKMISSTQVASTFRKSTAEANEPVPYQESTIQTKLQMAEAPLPKSKSSSDIENTDENRTIQNENWLLSQEPTCFTIQIMGVHNEKFLLNFIKTNKLLKQNEIAYYQSTFNSKPWYHLLYGIYPTRKGAQLAINKLPENIRKAKPWIRNISKVQKEISDRKR